MALKDCPECSGKVSDKAAACPHCGAPLLAATAPTHAVDPKTALRFRNPRTGKTVSIANAWLWTLLFGCFYFLVRGVIIHAAISLALAFITMGISWLIYPFFAQRIVRDQLIETGWVSMR